MRSKQLLPVLSAILLASGALAEDNLTKLGQFKTTGVTEFTTIAQDGPAANSIRNILRTIELPPGFTIDLYALVPDARHMAMAPQGTALFVGTKKEKVWVRYIRNCQLKAKTAPYYALISRVWRVFCFKQSTRGRPHEDQRLFCRKTQQSCRLVYARHIGYPVILQSNR